MRFEFRFADATLGHVLEIWSDESFYEDLAAHLKVEQHAAKVARSGDSLNVRQQLGFSTANVPQPFRALAPSRLNVDWASLWNLQGDLAEGRMEARAKEGNLSFAPTTTLRSSDGVVTWTAVGSVQLPSVPRLARGVAESKLSDFLEGVLKGQAEVTQRWLRNSAR